MKLLVVILLLLIAATGTMVYLQSFYEIAEDEAVVITQFGRPVGDPVTTAGRHLKRPFVQKANYFDMSLQELEVDSFEVPTRDEVRVQVTVRTRWQIADPLRFLQRLSHRGLAEARLGTLVPTEIRDEFGRHDYGDLDGSRDRINGAILENVRMRAAEWGLEILEIELHRNGGVPI